MDKTNAGASALPDGQEPVEEVVTLEKPDQPSEETVTEDAKKTEETEPSEEEDDLSKKPFHEHPRFQKMNREIKSLKTLTKEALELIKKQNEKLEQVHAEQKGEEYAPETKEKEYSNDFLWDNLEEGLDAIQEKEGLSDSQREAVYALAEKYAEDTDDGAKIPLRPDIAFKLWKDISGKKTPDTKPSRAVKESNTNSMTMDFPKNFQNQNQMWAQLRKQAASFNNL